MNEEKKPNNRFVLHALPTQIHPERLISGGTLFGRHIFGISFMDEWSDAVSFKTLLFLHRTLCYAESTQKYNHVYSAVIETLRETIDPPHDDTGTWPNVFQDEVQDTGSFCVPNDS